jgi:antitoxin (DNA-binding transcriptional repressor) of toxin-antitoxin stability system
MSDAPDNERDPRPVSAGQRGPGGSGGLSGPGGQGGPGGLSGRGAGGGSRAAARTREPGRPASRAEPAGRTGSRHRIGIRELRQHASVYVDLAEKGYTVDITNRGRLVAQLVPVTEPGSPLERLIAAGIIEPAEEPGGVGDLEPYPSRGAQP